jgi:hypothetical protein
VYQGPENQREQLAIHRELLCQPTQSPVPYLGRAVDAMLEQLETLQATRRSLEAIVPLNGSAAPPPAASLQNLPEVLRGLNDYFMHVAARVARLRDSAAAARGDCLRVSAARGDFFNPFVDADRREAEAAAAAEMTDGDRGRVANGVALQAALQPVALPAASAPLALPAPSGAGTCPGGSFPPIHQDCDCTVCELQVVELFWAGGSLQTQATVPLLREAATAAQGELLRMRVAWGEFFRESVVGVETPAGKRWRRRRPRRRTTESEVWLRMGRRE